jgi:hypothetical protein
MSNVWIGDGCLRSLAHLCSTYHIRFKQQAAKNLLNEPVSRACLDRVDATVSVRILSISTVQHFDLELLIL